MLFTRQLLWPALTSLAIGVAADYQITTASLTASTAIYTTTSATSTASSTGAVTHTVKVGPKESPMSYVPRNITAAVGDVVVFEFYPTNHSVVKADYLAPCVPTGNDLFYSGMFETFDEVNGNAVGPLPTWNLTINDTSVCIPCKRHYVHGYKEGANINNVQPIFYYCTAPNSCLENGMVGVINEVNAIPALNER
ncbi:hypothetical protein N7495_007778 [Penicillium taxi]|uniref:uncharacterized protein n=1 Tax=Penicillium taxi TaxID=168475 RepID=UPI0025458495|nr:uncharacterized protein N7495_007778 [Penicillium taxi]KAJ5887737.1 hypothetical protein N7495_007778 [Penicillium taxi]